MSMEKQRCCSEKRHSLSRIHFSIRGLIDALQILRKKGAVFLLRAAELFRALPENGFENILQAFLLSRVHESARQGRCRLAFHRLPDRAFYRHGHGASGAYSAEAL